MSLSFYQELDYSRALAEPESDLEPEYYRSQFSRDYARILHSPSFRRLQGKTQLFPGIENDFFRNRLTHSLEVAQIARAITRRINATCNVGVDNTGEKKTAHKQLDIDEDLVCLAALAHDLGHPPFGHQGEEILDELMVDYGGFEGNAQTFRILSVLEKKVSTDIGPSVDEDQRIGLNLCARTLASVLKYDKDIPFDTRSRLKRMKEENAKKRALKKNIRPYKGYYQCDARRVNEIKDKVDPYGVAKPGKFKTIECQIMDIADDIAYSTFDLEDALKAKFISPLDFLFPKEEIREKIRKKVNEALVKDGRRGDLSEREIHEKLPELFVPLMLPQEPFDELTQISDGTEMKKIFKYLFETLYIGAQEVQNNGYHRMSATSGWIGRAIRSIEFEPNEENLALSTVRLSRDMRIKVEILKQFTFLWLIDSPRLKIAEYRGKEIVKTIFESLEKKGVGEKLLPADVQEVLSKMKEKPSQQRVICDYVASMTDRYAIEFYARLKSERPETIFKPF
ncbi:MAG: dNTP triphosphohydrolase [Cryomorphaceae bacterium]|nr:MAG: dNTP triphosphohydrolase [Cryomorphaceae bacterium]